MRSRFSSLAAALVLSATAVLASPGAAVMANAAPVTYTIPSTPIAAGTTQFPYSNVTSQVAGHTFYHVGADVSAWQPTDNITIGIVFRTDGVDVANGCVLTTNGGVHLGMDGVTPFDPECGGPLPAYTSRLEMALTITVPSAHSMSGYVGLL